MTADAVYLGIDFGTSGARAIAITPSGQVVVQVHQSYEPHVAEAPLADSWSGALWSLLFSLPLAVRQRCQAIAIDGTSGTVLLCDRIGRSLTTPLLYHEAMSAVTIPSGVLGPARSRTSSLAKALWWWQTLPAETLAVADHFLHQADWLAGLLHGRWGVSDYHNALKLGYDVGALQYPDGLRALPFYGWLPDVLTPGHSVGRVRRAISDRFDLPATCQVKAGTTDSIAAFLASGASTPGTAVTSLGSTLVLKLLSQQPVEESKTGIYSHRLGNFWLAGGASNTGGAVLRHYFTDEELASLSAGIKVAEPTALDYYPLLQPGERFPVNDPDYPPRLTPKPDDPVLFLQGLLEGMAHIEAKGYRRLMALGSSPLNQVYTAGGGAKNSAWTAIRGRQLGVPMMQGSQTEAAYGVALLAKGLPLFQK